MGPNNQPPMNPTPPMALHNFSSLNIRLYRRQLRRSVSPLDAWVTFPTRSYPTTALATSNEPPRLDALDEGRTDNGKGNVRVVDSDETYQPEPEPVSRRTMPLRIPFERPCRFPEGPVHQENSTLLFTLFVLDRQESRKSTASKSSDQNRKQIANRKAR